MKQGGRVWKGFICLRTGGPVAEAVMVMALILAFPEVGKLFNSMNDVIKVLREFASWS